jgi:hypothetical protein
MFILTKSALQGNVFRKHLARNHGSGGALIDEPLMKETQ